MGLEERLLAFKQNFEAGGEPYNVSPEVVELQHRATNELIASGAANQSLKVGDNAPVFALASESGAIVRSDVLLSRGPVVLSFYRGVWCPYCNIDLEELQAALPEIEQHGATLLALSPQSPINSRKSKRQTGAAFDILVDKGNAIARKFGLVHKLPDYLIEGVYKPLGADLTAFNGDQSWELPMPARFVISPTGQITYAEVSADYTERPDPKVLIAVLSKLAEKAAS